MSRRSLVNDVVEAGAPGMGVAAADRRTRSRPSPMLIAALAAVWILWGSTFAGMRLAVATIPPFAMASLRFTIAGAILYAICALRGRWRVGRGELVRASVTGALLLLLGNGVMAWTVQFLPTGINSLLLSVSPIWMALIAYAWGRERPSGIAIAGMVIGFAGLALLLAPHASVAFPFWPTTLTVLASIAWALGSVYQRRAGASDFVLATALQMLVGGALLAAEAALFGEWRSFDMYAVSASSFAGFSWLVVCGSLLGYSAYLYTMQAASTAVASTYAYVNPVVAIAIGVAFFHERFSLTEGIASAIILGGVSLMMLPPRRRAA